MVGGKILVSKGYNIDLFAFYSKIVLENINKIDGGRSIISKEKIKIACGAILEVNADCVRQFKKRIPELGRSASDTVIVMANVEDPFGVIIAKKLMSEREWQNFDSGTDVFVKKLAVKEDMQNVIEILDKDASDKLKGMTEIAVIIISYGEIEIFPA